MRPWIAAPVAQQLGCHPAAPAQPPMCHLDRSAAPQWRDPQLLRPTRTPAGKPEGQMSRGFTRDGRDSRPCSAASICPIGIFVKVIPE